MNVEREAVECHGTDESYPRGHGIHNLKVTIEPQSFKLGQHIERLKLLEVENLRVWQPKLLDKGNINRNPGICIILGPKILFNFLLK